MADLRPARQARTLLVGKGGQIGHALERALRPLGPLHATDRAALDLLDASSIRKVIREVRPSLIVNAAAYTAVDRAEEEESMATAVNAEAPAVMAEEAALTGATLIHFSTDYVFDGAAASPYLEDDPTRPINAYGRSKLAGERAVLASGALAFIFRISWVYDRERRNFLTTIRRMAGERDILRIVDDQVGTPTWSGAVAESIARIASVLGDRADDRAWVEERAGIYHLGGLASRLSPRPQEAAEPTGVSWADFAAEILRVMPIPGRERVRIERIPSSAYPTPAARPAFSVLDASKAADVFGVRLPPWREQLRACARSD